MTIEIALRPLPQRAGARALRYGIALLMPLLVVACGREPTAPGPPVSADVEMTAQLPSDNLAPMAWDCYTVWGADGSITTQCDWYDDPGLLPPVQDPWGGGYGGYGGANPGLGNPGGGGYGGGDPYAGGVNLDQILTGRVVPGTEVIGRRKIGQFDDWTCNAADRCAPDKVTLTHLDIQTKTQAGQFITFRVENVTLHRKPYSSHDLGNRVTADYSFDLRDARVQSSNPPGIRLIYINNVPLISTLIFTVVGGWQGGMGQIGQHPIYYNSWYGNPGSSEENVIFIPLGTPPPNPRPRF